MRSCAEIADIAGQLLLCLEEVHDLRIGSFLVPASCHKAEERKAFCQGSDCRRICHIPELSVHLELQRRHLGSFGDIPSNRMRTCRREHAVMHDCIVEAAELPHRLDKRGIHQVEKELVS